MMDIFKKVCKTFVTVGGLGLLAAELLEGPEKIKKIWAKNQEGEVT